MSTKIKASLLTVCTLFILANGVILLPFCKIEPDKNKNINKITTAKKMSYQQTLTTVKSNYPFNRWRESYDMGLEQYTQENCDKAQHIIDQLIEELIEKGENAPEEEKVGLFKSAVLSLNELSEEIDDLIETGEREDLCDLIDKITIAAGLNPKHYSDGEGIADEWREW